MGESYEGRIAWRRAILTVTMFTSAISLALASPAHDAVVANTDLAMFIGAVLCLFAACVSIATLFLPGRRRLSISSSLCGMVVYWATLWLPPAVYFREHADWLTFLVASIVSLGHAAIPAALWMGRQESWFDSRIWALLVTLNLVFPALAMLASWLDIRAARSRPREAGFSNQPA